MNLRPAFAVSLFVHALAVAAVVWISLKDEGPLPGRGGGSGVTVEIVGGLGPRGGVDASGLKPEILEPETPKPKPDAPKILSQKESPRKTKPGSPQGDAIPVGTPGPAGPGQGAGEPGPGSGAGDGRDRTLAEIHARIERAKRYPMMARKMNMEGVSFVRFEIDAEGKPQELSLKESSGFPLLDDEALATIRRAAPFPSYADSLVIGIRFRMEPPPSPP